MLSKKVINSMSLAEVYNLIKQLISRANKIDRLHLIGAIDFGTHTIVSNSRLKALNIDIFSDDPIPSGTCKVCKRPFNSLDSRTQKSRPIEICTACFTSNA